MSFMHRYINHLRTASILLPVTVLLLWNAVSCADEQSSRIIKTESLHPRIDSVTWYSRELQKQKRFSIVYPTGYSKEEVQDDGKQAEWPVLFLLHGRGRHDRSLIEDEASCESLLQAQFIVILPQGDDGWYIDSPVRQKDKYESALAELIQLAEDNYPISRQAPDRALAGWSMGGYGAMHFLVEHPDEFSAIVTLIGLLDFPREGLPPGQDYAVPTARFGEDREMWRKLNPLTQAHQLKQKSILIVTAREAFDRTMNENFSQRLRELQIPHDIESLPGGHTFPVVRSGLSHLVPFLNKHFDRKD